MGETHCNVVKLHTTLLLGMPFYGWSLQTLHAKQSLQQQKTVSKLCEVLLTTYQSLFCQKFEKKSLRI